ncbi:MAG: hypothetical protein Q9170_000679 [Blastenia crenularia]
MLPPPLPERDALTSEQEKRFREERLEPVMQAAIKETGDLVDRVHTSTTGREPLSGSATAPADEVQGKGKQKASAGKATKSQGNKKAVPKQGGPMDGYVKSVKTQGTRHMLSQDEPSDKNVDSGLIEQRHPTEGAVKAVTVGEAQGPRYGPAHKKPSDNKLISEPV